MDAVAEWGFAPSVEEKLPKLITAHELANQLDSISLHRIYELCRAGSIPHVKVGRSVLFAVPAIASWLASGGTAADERDA